MIVNYYHKQLCDLIDMRLRLYKVSLAQLDVPRINYIHGMMLADESSYVRNVSVCAGGSLTIGKNSYVSGLYVARGAEVVVGDDCVVVNTFAADNSRLKVLDGSALIAVNLATRSDVEARNTILLSSSFRHGATAAGWKLVGVRCLWADLESHDGCIIGEGSALISASFGSDSQLMQGQWTLGRYSAVASLESVKRVKQQNEHMQAALSAIGGEVHMGMRTPGMSLSAHKSVTVGDRAVIQTPMYLVTTNPVHIGDDLLVVRSPDFPPPEASSEWHRHGIGLSCRSLFIGNNVTICGKGSWYPVNNGAPSDCPAIVIGDGTAVQYNTSNSRKGTIASIKGYKMML